LAKQQNLKLTAVLVSLTIWVIVQQSMSTIQVPHELQLRLMGQLNQAAKGPVGLSVAKSNDKE
jgi:hypothetical protein